MIHAEEEIEELTSHKDFNILLKVEDFYPEFFGVFIVFFIPEEFKNDFDLIFEDKIQNISQLAKNVITKGSGLAWNKLDSVKNEYITNNALLMLNSPQKYAKFIKEKETYKFSLNENNFLKL